MIEALVQRFLQSDGEALFLVPDQRIMILQERKTKEIGREVLPADAFEFIVNELVPGAFVDDLIDVHRTLQYTLPGSDTVDVRFGKIASRPAVMIYRLAPKTVVTKEEILQVLSGDAKPAEPVPEDQEVKELLSVDEPTENEPPREQPGHAEPQPAALFPVIEDRVENPIDRFLLTMLSLQASDLHFVSGEIPFCRVHGEMKRLPDFSALGSSAIENYLKDITPEKNRKEFVERNDTDFAYEIPGHARFRVNMFRDRIGVGAVLRQIPTKIKTVEDLNLPPQVVAFGDLAKGLVLVTGPTGSGKSTTLAAIIDYVNRKRSDHIITIEDPIEFVHPNQRCLVNQREVGMHTMGFKPALRAALREDPDVILVGEMRDLETIAIAIETAETGHLVFGTLHTNNAISTVDRIVDQFPADRQQQIRVMLGEALKGVVSQMLLKGRHGGRIAALEILIVTSAISNLIREGKTFQIQSMMQTSKNLGMVLMNDCLLELVQKGQVEAKEAYAKAMDKAGLMDMFKANEISLTGDKSGKKPDPAKLKKK